MGSLKSALMGGVCLAVLALPSAAFAQEVAPATTPAPDSGTVAATASGSGSTAAPAQDAAPPTSPQVRQEGTGLEEIVVTAQRRSQNLQDVPIAVTALSANTLASAGVDASSNLQAVTPGLDYSRQSGNGAAPFIRGVGSVQTNIGSEAPVAIYVDDVYVAGGQSNLFSFNNIDQIEVLKGPQGTLFGRNATAGVIVVHTRQPSQEAHLDAQIGYGNYNTIEGNFYATGPITDTLAIDFAATGEKQYDGYGRNVTLDEDIYKSWNWGIRSSLLWRPSSRTSVRLIGDFGRQFSELGLNPSVNPGTISSGLGEFVGRYLSESDTIDSTIARWGGVSLNIQQDLDWAKLVSITAYRHLDYRFLFDQDAGPVSASLSDTDPIQNTISEELQLQSPHNGRFNWILGFFYYHAKAGEHPIRNYNFVGGVPVAGANAYSDLNDDQYLNSYSGFGEINYELVPGLKVTAGLRYTSDDYHFDVLKTDALGATLAGGEFSQDATFSKLTYRGILSYNFTPDIMLYGSVSRGFKSGGFNVAGPGNAPGADPVAPEVLDAYEGGLKMEFLNHTIRVNMAAFHYDYSNLQVTIIGPGSSSVINAAAARINGFDFDATFAPIARLTINTGFTLLDGNYTDFRGGPLYVPKPGVCTPVPQTTGPLTGGNLQCSADLSGNTTIRTPRFTGNINVAYHFPTQIGRIGVSGNFYYNSGYYWEPDNRTRQNNYTLLNATLSWTSTNGCYEASIWGRNLTNTYYVSFGSESALRDSQSPAPPRTYGVTFGVHF